MTFDYAERFALSGKVHVSLPGYEAEGADGTEYRITRTPYGRSGFTWELYTLAAGEVLHKREPLGFSARLYAVQELAQRQEDRCRT